MQVDFYLISNQVADAKYKLASRLSNKLQRLKHKTLIVTQDKYASQQLDQLMWSFSDISFVAHERLKGNVQTAATIHITEVTRLSAEMLNANYQVLLNLSSKVPEFHHYFDRIAEIVEQDESAKAAARQRFKQYQSQGFELSTHPIEL